MIELKFFKDGEYKKIPVNQGWVISETKNEELDEVTIMFSGEENAVRLWQSVRVGESFFNISYIQSDEKRGKRFKYIIKVIEPTKYLEKIICPSMAFTNKNNNLKEQLERAILNAEPVEVGSAPRFKLAKGIKSYLESIDGADFYFERSTLREVLDEMFAVIDARCVVKELSNFNNIEIDFVSLANRKNLIDITRYSKRRSIENIELLGSDIESYAENAISTEDNLLWHPSANGWDTFKTNESTLTTENAVISTVYPIERIEKLIIKLPVLVLMTGHYGGTMQHVAYSTNEIEISRNVVDEKMYDILLDSGAHSPVKTEELYSNNTVWFSRGSTQISYEVRKELFWTYTFLETAIRNALWNSPEAKQIREENVDEYLGYNIESISNFPKIDKILFKLQYQPLINVHFKIGKEKYQGPPSTIISQQTAKTIDIARYGDNLYGQINRLGNPELEYDMIVTDPNDIYQLGDYTKNDYILTTREMAVYDRFIKCHYKFTKNFNALSSRIGIAREKRVYNIPLEFFKSDTIIKEYIVADFGDKQAEQLLDSYFMLTFIDQERFPFNLALIQTRWGTEGSDYFQLPLATYAAANAMHFHFTFVDNYSAGMSIENRVIGGKKVSPNLYVNEIGEYEEIEINLINEYDKREEYQADIETAKALPKTEWSYYLSPGSKFSRTYKMIKDAYEHKSFTIILEIKSNDKDIVIGQELAKSNALINYENKDLYIYVSNEKYNLGAKYVKGSLATNQSIFVGDEEYEFRLGYLTVSFDDVNISSWAIGDVDRNLYLACNNPEERSIQFRHKKEL